MPAAFTRGLLSFLNSLGLQTCLYLAFVFIFQKLAGATRLDNEFLFDRHLKKNLIKEDFDGSHNTFEDIRRIADIYEWGNRVLWPSLFDYMAPCGVVGRDNVRCHGWPDGDELFSRRNATTYDAAELVTLMDKMDWTEGVLFRQARVAPQVCDEAPARASPEGVAFSGGGGLAGAMCYPELTVGSASVSPFGFNRTHPWAPLDSPWTHFNASQLGSKQGDEGIVSAAIPSRRSFETAGFIALVIPFFSLTFLPEQRGTIDQIVDYRLTSVNTTNGRPANFFCARISRNGRDFHQLCDPTTKPEGNGRMAGVVRAAVEEMWNELKYGHFIDSRTRLLTIILQLKSNAVGVRYRLTMMLELTSLGAILPSYDSETRTLSAQAESDLFVYSKLSLSLVIFFALLEVIEVFNSGIYEYLSDLWNLMDWINYTIFFVAWVQVCNVAAALEQPDCSSFLCEEVGYFDDWRLMSEYRNMKQFLSLCICIQLLKVIKLAAQLVPKVGYMSSVLRTSVVDLFFFGVVFIISVIAFSMMLYVQLGNVMERFFDQFPSFVTLARGLFGDFDLDEIMNNSSGYGNVILFLAFLFVAIFLVLSLFLTILAEASVRVRELESERRKDPEFNEYGVCQTCLSHTVRRLAFWWLGRSPSNACAGSGAESSLAAVSGVTTLERSQMREVDSLRQEVNAMGDAVRQLTSALNELRAAPAAPVARWQRASEGAVASTGCAGPVSVRGVCGIVEALDDKLSRGPLASIDARLFRREVRGKARAAATRPAGHDTTTGRVPPLTSARVTRPPLPFV